MRFRLFVAVLAALPLALVSTTPATAANADVFVLTGNVTFSPGLTAAVQSLTFTGAGTLTNVGTNGIPATYPCTYSGNVMGSVASGNGSAAVNCGAYGVSNCTVVYVAGKWYWICVRAFVVLAADCTYSYNTLPPATSASVTCFGKTVTVP